MKGGSLWEDGLEILDGLQADAAFWQVRVLIERHRLGALEAILGVETRQGPELYLMEHADAAKERGSKGGRRFFRANLKVCALGDSDNGHPTIDAVVYDAKGEFLFFRRSKESLFLFVSTLSIPRITVLAR